MDTGIQRLKFELKKKVSLIPALTYYVFEKCINKRRINFKKQKKKIKADRKIY